MASRILGALLLLASLLQMGCLCCPPWGHHRCCKPSEPGGDTAVARPLVEPPPTLPRAF
jgi:hypothetical protein